MCWLGWIQARAESAQAAGGPKLGLPQWSLEVAGSGAQGSGTEQSDHPVWIQL